MPLYANQDAFDESRSRLIAVGTDLSPDKALVDASGNVMAHARTGGMIDPARYVVAAGTRLYRFGGDRSPRDIAQGGWWVEQREFDRLVNFAISNSIYLGLAMRLLCLVPPEWSDATVLVRARVTSALLAWRGLGNSVVTPMKGVQGMVRMPHSNEISARRLHQLYIPGLARPQGVEHPVSIEDVRRLDPRESNLGFLYL
ncbi:MAG: hypothetical protein RIQ60_2764 [Pseudomonadota bacterium]|jgi:hypothetical protein